MIQVNVSQNFHFHTNFHFSCRYVSIDEGGFPFYGNSAHRSYIPGKPSPNCLEFICSVDRIVSLTYVQWGKATFYDKFQQKGRIDELAKTIVEHQTSYGNRKSPTNQPFHFFLDSRFSSLKLMELMKQNHFNFVMSCSSIMKPKSMMDLLKKDTPLRHWRMMNNHDVNCRLMGHHVKKNKYLFLTSNYASYKPVWVEHRRCKYPKEEYQTKEPKIINEYNCHMGYVDLFDKMVQQYWRSTKYIHHDHAYTTFFIHAYMRSSILYSLQSPFLSFIS